jgi:GNAT superfamily N-acetyltransferase
VRRELLGGLRRLSATTTVLQRARLADPLGGMWEAADVQWWWRRRRATDDLALPVWFDEAGPVAAAGLTAWDGAWQADVFAVPSLVDERDVWAETLEAVAAHRGVAVQVLVFGDAPLADLAVAADGRVAGYALFWFDPVTRVGLLEPMRVEDGYQRRGLARTLLTNGLDRLARKGALRLKVGFDSDAARDLYLGAGFVQTSVDRTLIRPATAMQRYVTPGG